MKKIITISREYGAGAGEIGRAIADELGYDYFDKAIILKAAGEANLDVENAIRADEKLPINFSFAQSLFDFYNRPLSEKVFEAQSEVIKKIGEKGSCVIVGRNANTILKHFDNSLHVFFCADPEWRKLRMMKQFPDMTEKQMADQLAAIDRQRTKYCSYHTKTEFGGAKYYDLCLNTSRLGMDYCRQLILDAVRE